MKYPYSIKSIVVWLFLVTVSAAAGKKLPPLAKQIELERVGLAQLADVPEDCRRDAPYGVIGFGTMLGKQWEYLRLITVAEAQEELKLTKQQIQQLKPIGSYFLTQQRHWAKTASDKQFFSKEMSDVCEILNRDQIVRLDQIVAQRKGIRLFFDSDFQAQLKLTPAVVAKIKNAWREHAAKAKLGWKGREGQLSLFKVWEYSLSLLSKKQRRRFDKTTGTLIVTFDLPAMHENLKLMEKRLADQDK